MPSKDLTYRLVGSDVSASKTFKSVGDHGEGLTHRLGGAFSSLGSKIGGEFGEVLTTVGEGFEKMGEKGTSGLAKIAATGAGLAGVGAVLTGMGDKERAATQQLDQAITNTGHSAEEFGTQIEETVHHMERYGDSAVTTKTALMTLTNATHDPKKAIDLMGTAADLAAAKHISLNDAASLLAKGLNGSAKVFKQFGIQVKVNADGTKDYEGAVRKLAQVVSGQANAAADTWTGKLKALRTEVTDNVAALGAKYGPAITAVGVGMIALAPILGAARSAVGLMGKAYRSTAIMVTGSGAEIAAAQARVAAADVAVAEAATASAATQVAAAEEVAAANSELALASGRATGARGLGAVAGSVGKFTLGVGLAAVGVYALGKSINSVIEGDGVKNFTTAMVNSEKATNDLRTAVVNSKQPFGVIGAAWATAAIQSTGLAEKAAKAGITVDEMSAAIRGGAESTRALIERWKQTGKPSNATIKQLLGLAQGYDASATAADKASTSTDANSTALAGARAAMKAAKVAAGDLASAFSRMNDQTMNAEEANIAFRNSETAVADSVKQNGKSLSITTTAGRANRTAVLASIQAAQAHAAAVGKQTGSIKKATDAFNGDVGALRSHLTALGLNKDEIQRIIDKYGHMPPSVLTKIKAQDLATKKIHDAETALWGANGKTAEMVLNVNTVYRVKGGNGAGRQFTAGGSDFFSGGETTIAEREPEAVYLPRGSRVVPQSRMHATAGGPSITVNINVPQIWGGSTHELGRVVAGALEQYAGAGGKVRIARAIN